jgi:hypothetical protein
VKDAVVRDRARGLENRSAATPPVAASLGENTPGLGQLKGRLDRLARLRPEQIRSADVLREPSKDRAEQSLRALFSPVAACSGRELVDSHRLLGALLRAFRNPRRGFVENARHAPTGLAKETGAFRAR